MGVAIEMRIPVYLLVHDVTVTPYLGESSTGPLYGDSFTLACMAQGGVRIVRANDGTTVTASLTVWCEPGQASSIPPGSLVKWRDGPAQQVLLSIDHDSGGLGAPDHTEIACQ